MKTQKQNFTKLGIFVLLGTLLFVVAIFYIGRQQHLFGNNFRLVTHYRSIEGLMVGNNVRFSGINVGVVDEISILNDTTVEVTLLIEESVRKFIKQDSKADISSNGLMGDRVINIQSGRSETIVKDGDMIASVKPFSIDELIDPLKKTAENARDISNDLAVVSNNIKEGKGTIGRLFTDEEMAEDISATVSNANDASKKLDENMEALKSNFLLRGYYRRKERREKKRQEKLERAQEKKAEKEKEKQEKKK